MTSTGPPGLIVTRAVALGKQPEATGLAALTIGNSCCFSCAAAFMPAKLTRAVAATTVVPIEPVSFIFILSKQCERRE